MWGQTWEPITGRVKAAKICSVRGGEIGPSQHKYVIEYQVDGGKAQRVELKQPWGFSYPKMIHVREGGTVPLLLNRRSGKVRFDVKNAAINYKARLRANKADRKAEYDRTLKG